jgi:cystathionine beta-lyase
MDFRSPPAVLDALVERIEHGVFGYTAPSHALVETIVSMLDELYAWKVEPKWLVWLPGLVTGINVSCRAVGGDDDEVITAVPVYPPFLTAPEFSRRNLVTVPLSEADDEWQFDLDRFERAITSRTRLFLLCSPHNPTGRIFTADELAALAQVCARHDVVICSDEIHCGLLLDQDKKHIPTATLSPDVARATITLMAPSKTFNLPGLGCSFAIIPDRDLRRGFVKAMAGIVPHVNTLGYTATLAAYRDSHRWHEQLLEYLRANRELVEETIRGIPGLAMKHVEATYLAWIDARALGLDDPATFFEGAGVGLSHGKDFGGPGFVRLNFGCRRATLEEALSRMARAVDGLVKKQNK